MLKMSKTRKIFFWILSLGSILSKGTVHSAEHSVITTAESRARSGWNHSTKTGGSSGREGQKRPIAQPELSHSLRSSAVVSLMSELLNALDGRSRGVNAPFACLDLAPNSNPVPGVRLTIAAIAVAKKPVINPSSTLPRAHIVCTV